MLSNIYNVLENMGIGKGLRDMDNTGRETGERLKRVGRETREKGQKGEGSDVVMCAPRALLHMFVTSLAVQSIPSLPSITTDSKLSLLRYTLTLFND